MITDTYKILKLISGENIICELTEENGKYEISKPLLMHVHPNITMGGMTESLMLSRWVQPFTEQTYFEIDPKHVIIMLPASPGLSVYYEGVLNKIEGGTERISLGDHINEDDIYDELLEDLEPESKIIH
jgi:hypothetical protein